MKFLAVSDPHGSKKAFNAIKKKSKKVDYILLAGDFTIFGNNIRKIMKDYDSLDVPVLLIPGNHEIPEEVEAIAAKHDNLFYIDEMLVELGSTMIFAIEGNGFAQKDRHFEAVAKKLIPTIKKKKKEYGKDFKLILMTHAPVYNTTTDKIWGDEHCGNDSIRKFIMKHKPLISIVGHIHETFGAEDTVGDTKVINPGPEGVVIEL